MKKEMTITELKQKEIEIYEIYRKLPNGAERLKLNYIEKVLMIKRHAMIHRQNIEIEGIK